MELWEEGTVLEHQSQRIRSGEDSFHAVALKGSNDCSNLGRSKRDLVALWKWYFCLLIVAYFSCSLCCITRTRTHRCWHSDIRKYLRMFSFPLYWLSFSRCQRWFIQCIFFCFLFFQPLLGAVLFHSLCCNTHKNTIHSTGAAFVIYNPTSKTE